MANWNLNNLGSGSNISSSPGQPPLLPQTYMPSPPPQGPPPPPPHSGYGYGYGHGYGYGRGYYPYGGYDTQPHPQQYYHPMQHAGPPQQYNDYHHGNPPTHGGHGYGGAAPAPAPPPRPHPPPPPYTMAQPNGSPVQNHHQTQPQQPPPPSPQQGRQAQHQQHYHRHQHEWFPQNAFEHTPGPQPPPSSLPPMTPTQQQPPLGTRPREIITPTPHLTRLFNIFFNDPGSSSSGHDEAAVSRTQGEMERARDDVAAMEEQDITDPWNDSVRKAIGECMDARNHAEADWWLSLLVGDQ